ncbi:MAG TPA: hypothetical protein VHE99_11475 [Gammaproteobacteria bacterium]|nr:hypothetical protein [Gammaproteobacteria bacterium]
MTIAASNRNCLAGYGPVAADAFRKNLHSRLNGFEKRWPCWHGFRAC